MLIFKDRAGSSMVYPGELHLMKHKVYDIKLTSSLFCPNICQIACKNPQSSLAQSEAAPPSGRHNRLQGQPSLKYGPRMGQQFSTRLGPEWMSDTSLGTLESLADVFLQSKTIYLEEAVHWFPIWPNLDSPRTGTLSSTGVHFGCDTHLPSVVSSTVTCKFLPLLEI